MLLFISFQKLLVNQIFKKKKEANFLIIILFSCYFSNIHPIIYFLLSMRMDLGVSLSAFLALVGFKDVFSFSATFGNSKDIIIIHIIGLPETEKENSCVIDNG